MSFVKSTAYLAINVLSSNNELHIRKVIKEEEAFCAIELR